MRYVKPELGVTVFTLNQAITACETTTSTQWNNQTINCVIEGEETIFYDGCESSADNGMLIWYDNQYYYAWQGAPKTAPSEAGLAKLQAIMAAGGVNEAKGWHAGPASPEIISVHNMS